MKKKIEYAIARIKHFFKPMKKKVKCHICKKDYMATKNIFGYGLYCSQKCFDIQYAGKIHYIDLNN